MDILPVAKSITMSCMRKGIVAYPETNEQILLEQSVLEKMAKSARGIPVLIEHPGIPVDHETIKTLPVHGRVSGMRYVADEDEWYADFTIETQEAADLLQKGYGVSTGWYPKKYGPAGTYNAVPYTQSLVDGEYEHLAIVSKPRYEMARDPIFLNSLGSTCKSNAQPANIVTKQSTLVSKPVGRKTTMFSLFRNKREDIKVNEGDEVMVNMDGQDCKLSELVESYKKSKAVPAPEAPKKNVLGDDDMVDIDGESMSVRDLIAAVKATRKDAAVAPDEAARTEEDLGFAMQDKDDAASVADAIKGNKDFSEDGDSKGEAIKAKTNANFDKLKEVHENGVAEDEQEAWLSTHKRMEMGRARYGSPTK